MEANKAIELIEKTDTDFDIKNRKYKGLQILSKYVEELDFAAEHDIVYICDFESTVKKMTEEEVKNLALHGLLYSEDSWAFFT